MFGYLGRRALYAIPLLIVISFVSFGVIQLPPGDYMTALQAQLVASGNMTQEEALATAEALREAYGMDQPFLVQYFTWVIGVVQGDFGYSFTFRRPVSEVIWQRLGWTFLIALFAFLVSIVWGISPGIYAATHQYGAGDNALTVLSYLGLAVPNFFLALVVMYVLVFWVGVGSVGGLFSPEYVMQPWSWPRFVDFLGHFWLPVVVVGVAGTARNLRVMRANLLDILHLPYIQTARAKGLGEGSVIYKHAAKNALAPIIMYFGMSLPFLIEGAVITAVVLNLPTTGPVFLEALRAQDMHLAGSFLMMLAAVTVIGNILADVALAAIDPRVRFD